VERAPTFPVAIPSADQVARGWVAQSRGGMRLALPDPRLQEAVDANRRFLLALHDGPDITPGPSTYHRFWFRDAAFLLAALGQYGFSSQVAEVLRSYPGRQRGDGFFFSQPSEWDSNGCALWSIAEHWRLTRDRESIEPMLGSVAKGAQWVDRKRRAKRGRGPELRGLLPAGVSAEHLGPFDYFYWDDFWCTAGLRCAAELLAGLDQPGPAALVRQQADALWADTIASLGVVSRRLDSEVIPAGPRRRIDAGVIGSLVACEPLRLLAPEDRRIAATLEVVRTRFSLGDAFFQPISHTGLATYLTMQVAEVELAGGDRRALDRLAWLLDVATPTWTWPEAIHPQLPGGCMGDGHHGWAAASVLSLVRNLLVREMPTDQRRAADPGLALCSLFPDAWLGQGFEVHEAPTHFGSMSYAVRWHGERPALLWELTLHDDVERVRLTAPGLDPGWSTTEQSGEALLSAPQSARERGALSG
jgi:GH15 family glucan-1,4-alpha-glucosidase